MYGKYIVKTQGKIVQTQDQAYAVVAHNKNEAIEKAKELFMNDYPVIEDAGFRVKSFGVSIPLVLGIVLLLVAVLLSFFRWKNGHEMVNIRPGFVSVLYSVLLYSAYFVKFKGVDKLFKTISGPIYGVLIILLVSSFIQILFRNTSVSFFGINLPIDSKNLMVFAVILSWAGYRIMSVFCGILLFVVAISNLILIDGAMGNLYGTIYVLCSFFGLLAYMSCEPAFYQGVMDFRNGLLRSTSAFSNDYRYANDLISAKIVSSIEKRKSVKEGDEQL